MRELKVTEIRVSTGDAPPLVVLAEDTEPGRLLPIWMSHGGASAIFTATEEPDADRPAIHDLAARLVEAASEPMTAVQLIGYEDGQFFAELVFGAHTLPARASDAIALALRAGCPILCSDELLDEVAISPDPEPGSEDEVERFREFLDTVTPEDFSGDDGKG